MAHPLTNELTGTARVACSLHDSTLMGKVAGMLTKLKRLLVIKTRAEAYLVIYALGLGACERGMVYLDQYPGWGGKLLFLACTGAVFLAGAKILDALRLEREQIALERANAQSA